MVRTNALRDRGDLCAQSWCKLFDRRGSGIEGVWSLAAGAVRVVALHAKEFPEVTPAIPAAATSTNLGNVIGPRDVNFRSVLKP